MTAGKETNLKTGIWCYVNDAAANPIFETCTALVAPPVCAWTYTVTQTTLAGASALSFVPDATNGGGTISLSTSTFSLVSGTAYEITVTAKTPNGLAIAGTPASSKHTVTIITNPACNPPSSVTLPTNLIADQTYQVG